MYSAAAVLTNVENIFFITFLFNSIISLLITPKSSIFRRIHFFSVNYLFLFTFPFHIPFFPFHSLLFPFFGKLFFPPHPIHFPSFSFSSSAVQWISCYYSLIFSVNIVPVIYFNLFKRKIKKKSPKKQKECCFIINLFSYPLFPVTTFHFVTWLYDFTFNLNIVHLVTLLIN